LDNIIKDKNLVYDKYDRKGKIIYKGYYYIFQPLDLGYEKVPVELRIHPFPKKPRTIKLLDTVIKRINTENFEQTNHINENLLTNIMAEINNTNELLASAKKMDSSHGNSSYNYAVVGLVIDKINKKRLTEVIRQLIRSIYENKLGNEYNRIC
jgi:hypothetical protein